MDIVTIKCQNCGKRLITYIDNRTRKYKSPIVECKSCGTKCLDPRCHEIAVEGLPKDLFSVWSYVIMFVVGALILLRGLYLFGVRQLGTPNAIQWLLPTAFTIMGMIFAIGGVVEVIAIVTGLKKKKYDKLARESEERMRDMNYAYTLSKLGYRVPEKYLQ